MGQPFDRGSFIVLVLLFIFGVIFAYDTIDDFNQNRAIINETGARTELLLNRIKALETKVRKLEIKAGIAQVSKAVTAPSSKPASAPAAKKPAAKAK